MLIFADVTGQILRASTEGEIKDIPAKANPPGGAAFSLRFPDETNAGLTEALKSANFGGYTMPGGTLTVQGVPATVSLTAGSNKFPDIALVSSAVQKLLQYPQIDQLTADERNALFRDYLRGTGRLAGNQ